MKFLATTALLLVGLLIVASQVFAASADPAVLLLGFVLMGGGALFPNAPAPDVGAALRQFVRDVWRNLGEIAAVFADVIERIINALDYLTKGMWPFRAAVTAPPPAHQPTLAVGSTAYYIDRILTALRTNPDYDATDALIAEIHVELGGKVDVKGYPTEAPERPAPDPMAPINAGSSIPAGLLQLTGALASQRREFAAAMRSWKTSPRTEYPCPRCDGKWVGCRLCNGTGFVAEDAPYPPIR